MEREGKNIDLETIKDVLVKLSMGDLIEYSQMGNWFRKMKDPILNEFLKVWGRIQAAGENAARVRDEIRRKYRKLQKKFSKYKRYLAEVYMIQVLWNSQRKVLPGKYFHSPEDIHAPDRFFYIEHRGKLGAGVDMEVDIYAAAGETRVAGGKQVAARKKGGGQDR